MAVGLRLLGLERTRWAHPGVGANPSCCNGVDSMMGGAFRVMLTLLAELAGEYTFMGPEGKANQRGVTPRG